MKQLRIMFVFLLIILVGCQNSNEFKNELVNENQVYTGPIIDMHLHANKTETPLYGQTYVNPLTGKSYTAPNSLEEHQKETFARFKKYNIVKAVVSQYADVWDSIDPPRILYGRNHQVPIDTLRALYKRNTLDVIGEVAPNYHGMLPNDPYLIPYFDLAVELDLPMGYHLYPGGPPGGMYFVFPKTRAKQVKPLLLEEVLFNRPNLKIYIMHAGWPYLEDMKALMYAHPQVYVDVAVIDWALPKAEFHSFLKGLFDAGFGKRIMFGSDQMEWPQTIDDAIDNINSADFLSMQQKEDIFYDNAATFLGLSEEEIAKHKSTKAN